MHTPRPKIHFSHLPTDFSLSLQSQSDARAITLIICASRETFIQDLLLLTTPELQEARQDQNAEEITQDVHNNNNNNNSYASISQGHRPHPLLANTIGLISTSKRVKLAFCPTLEHARAYISLFHTPTTTIIESSKGQSQDQGRPLLAILNLVALHKHTSDFSAQGLSRTFSLAVEVAVRERVDLVLCECKISNDDEDDLSASGEELWDCCVPLLSGSVGAMGGERSRNVKTVRVEQVAKRWFDFDSCEISREVTNIHS